MIIIVDYNNTMLNCVGIFGVLLFYVPEGSLWILIAGGSPGGGPGGSMPGGRIPDPRTGAPPGPLYTTVSGKRFAPKKGMNKIM